jgi:hypothetical protein
VQLWHDTFTNEQYFGILATDPVQLAPPRVIYRGAGSSVVRQVTAWEDESYIHLAIVFASPPTAGVTLGLDTIPASSAAPPPGSADRRADYALVLDPAHRTGQTWVRESLAPDPIDFSPIPTDARQGTRAGWQMLELVTDRPWTLPLTHTPTAMQFNDVGLLRYGDWAPGAADYDSLALWHLNGAELDLRIPWAMAGLSDPSSHQALVPLGQFQATGVTVPDISLTVTGGAGPTQQTGTLRWQDVHYTERIKPGVGALHQAFDTVDGP